MNRAIAVLLSAAIGFGTAAGLSPHEVTYLGTITVLGEGTMEVLVIDEQTRAESPMTFQITEETTFYRGEHAVPFSEAELEVGERCAVMVNTDVPGNRALEVRLAGHDHP